MPFQSEKQRRYLWANEPEIARDWTDTYGSRIEKNDGGIMRVGLKNGAQFDTSKGGGAISPGTGVKGGLRHHGGQTLHGGTVSNKEAITIGETKKELRDLAKRNKEEKREELVEKFRHKNINNPLNKAMNYLPYIGILKKMFPKGTRSFFVDDVLTAGHYGGITEDQFYAMSPEEQEKALQDYIRARSSATIDAYGRTIESPRSGPPIYPYPLDVHPGTGGTEVAEVVEEDVPSNFQPVSMDQLPYPDYPLLADGGRIGRAYGGIMDSSTGRRAYGLGSIFKSIKKAAGKVLKSPIGKAALMYGAYKFGPAFLSKGMPGGDVDKWGALKWFGDERNVNLMKAIGIPALLPFTGLGQPDEDEDEGFDYDAAKNAYAQELMRIKAGVSAGSLNPNQWSYLPSNYTYTGAKDGGRIGMYAGGQSIPSEYTMEDAMMTTTQDKLGGITDVMKQADLNRKGTVGQFYAADGGRIGYDAGGQTGLPPITMGQVPQLPPQMPAPQVPHSPMPAPQPNRMAMNPMMNRPMMNPMMARGMNPMGGRRMAQEGGLMDMGGMEKDYRNDGGFVPIGGEEKADDVPARLSKNEFVFTADAVRGAGGGDIDKGAEIMENIMKNLEQGGQVSEETQGLAGAQEMFGVSERLSEVV